MKGQVSVKGIPLEEIVRIFYNTAKPVGMGLMQYNPNDITDDECKWVVEKKHIRPIPLHNSYEYLLDIDYLAGRLMKIGVYDDYSIDFSGWNKYYKDYDENKELNKSGEDLIAELRKKYPDSEEDNNGSPDNH